MWLWKTVGKQPFRSVLGLFEYKVMTFGFQGAPATFQANINAYLQPLLGQAAIAYLDGILIYSPDLLSHVAPTKPSLGAGLFEMRSPARYSDSTQV